jgi:hypothetical protein
MSMDFSSTISYDHWVLTNVWFHNIDVEDEVEWLLVADFNLICRPSDRNKPGGNMQEMLQFNVAISNLRLIELQLIGNKYTWINK